MINIKNFDSDLLNIDKISFKSTDAVIDNIKYITIENLHYVNIDSENPLYPIFNNEDGYIDENNDFTLMGILDFCLYRQKQRSIDKLHITLG